MANPQHLKVGCKVVFVSRPDEWSRPGFNVDPLDIEFMDRLIARGLPCKISQIDEHGNRWVNVRLKVNNVYEHHSWAIMENSGWRPVKPRTA